ncbi:MAG: hypothetical protein IIW71_08935 [Treponema sp.]|nr:hypothetical protein [Treponema sp.]
MKKFCLYGILIGTLLFVMGCNSENVVSYDIGDIVLSDGRVVPVEYYSFGEGICEPVGVVVGVSGNKAMMMGLHKSSYSMSWAPRDTFGYNTKFSDIEASRFGSVESGYTFSGDLIGRDNWLVVCNSDREGILEPKNYPAFYFAYNYGLDCNFLNSEFNYGWYLPSISELYGVFENREVLQKSLNVVGGFDFGNNWFWSSSQSYSAKEGVYGVSFIKGEVNNIYKYCSAGYVIAFHDLDLVDF